MYDSFRGDVYRWICYTIPWKIIFKQYNKNKRHKYGIQLFKLCIPPNYTICIKVYAGKEAVSDGSVGINIVLELAEPFLNFGRTMIVDNWYTSIELTEKLGMHNTYLIETLRGNRKSNPKEITQKKIKKEWSLHFSQQY